MKITAYFKQRNKFVFGNVHVCIVHIKYHVHMHIAYEMVMCMLYMFVYACLHAHECDTLAGVGEILDVNALAIVSEGAMCSI